MNTLYDILDSQIDGYANDFVVVAPNRKTRKLEVHAQLPDQYLDPVLEAIRDTFNNMKVNDDAH